MTIVQGPVGMINLRSCIRLPGSQEVAGYTVPNSLLSSLSLGREPPAAPASLLALQVVRSPWNEACLPLSRCELAPSHASLADPIKRSSLLLILFAAAINIESRYPGRLGMRMCLTLGDSEDFCQVWSARRHTYYLPLPTHFTSSPYQP